MVHTRGKAHQLAGSAHAEPLCGSTPRLQFDLWQLAAILSPEEGLVFRAQYHSHNSAFHRRRPFHRCEIAGFLRHAFE